LVFGHWPEGASPKLFLPHHRITAYQNSSTENKNIVELVTFIPCLTIEKDSAAEIAN
jgi:hypothetical protein